MGIARCSVARLVVFVATLLNVAALAANASADPPVAKPVQPITGRPMRVAVLNFGPPSSWQGEIENTVGVEIVADAWRRAIPMLERDKVDVVVVRVNSGGGYLFEMYEFHDVLRKMYKPRFRTVAWIESAISCAAMSIWVIEELYMMPESSLGAALGWRWGGPPVGMRNLGIEPLLRDMEEASRVVGRDPKIMRAMQIQEPLSYNIDENGSVTWFQDLSGKVVVNPANQILTLTVGQAVACKVARAQASSLNGLMKAMGIAEYELVGVEAAKFIDQSMRDNDLVARRLRELDTKYGSTLQAIRALRDPKDKDHRMQEMGVARATLKQMKQIMSGNPNFYLTSGRTKEWFAEQERVLKELAKD